MTAKEAPIPADELTIVPANEASWDDVAAIFGTTDYPGRCQCQRFKVVGCHWRDSTQEQRTEMLREQTACGDPKATATSGLVAYVDDEPAGWVAVEPRTAYPKLRTSRIPWSGRDEDKGDDGIWAVTCFVVRKGYRGRGLTYPLARASRARVLRIQTVFVLRWRHVEIHCDRAVGDRASGQLPPKWCPSASTLNYAPL